MATVLVLTSRKQRARKICPRLAAGVEVTGDKAKRMGADEYREPCSDVLLHYGFDGEKGSSISRAHGDYVRAGLKAVYVDLGYFKRRDILDRYEDYHRFSINARHPNAHLQLVKHPRDRADAVGVKVAPEMKQGKRIILCGMSEKASAFDGVIGWEEMKIIELRRHTRRAIIHRPKPGRVRKPQLPMIPTADGYSSPLSRSISDELKNAWAVVSHHSNAGLDALVAGVPCFQDDGAALLLGLSDLSMIEHPRLPSYEERQQLVNDVCYSQFNVAECESGMAWRHFKDEGLIP